MRVRLGFQLASRWHPDTTHSRSKYSNLFRWQLTETSFIHPTYVTHLPKVRDCSWQLWKLWKQAVEPEPKYRSHISRPMDLYEEDPQI